jgi:hypothetical protein
VASRSKLHLALLIALVALAFASLSVAARAQFQTPTNPSTHADPDGAAKSTASPTAAPQTPPANSSGMVWVNTDSGVYHKPGTRYYGKTKHGKYMLETDAIRAGYHPAEKTPPQ